jgi:hypothetical protein
MLTRAPQSDRPHELSRAVFFLIGPILAAIAFGIAYAAGTSLWVAIVLGIVVGGTLQPLAGRLLLPDISRQIGRERAAKPRYLSTFHDRGSGEWKRRRTGRPQS